MRTNRLQLRPPQLVALHQVMEQLLEGEWRFLDLGRPMRGAGDAILWEGAARLAFMDSITRGFPTGAIIVWRTTLELPTLTAVGGLPLRDASGRVKTYILDGTRRMAAIYAAFGLYAFKDFVPDDQTPPPLYANLWGFKRDGYLDIHDSISSAASLHQLFTERRPTPLEYERWWWNHLMIESELEEVSHWSELPLGLMLDVKMRFWYAQVKSNSPQDLWLLETTEVATNKLIRYPFTVLTIETDDLDDVATMLSRLHHQEPELGTRLRAQLSR